MAWFFSKNEIPTDTHVIVGENAKHIKVLRMREGEALTIVTPSQTQCEGEIETLSADGVTVKILSKQPCRNEPDVFVTLLFRNAWSWASAALCPC